MPRPKIALLAREAHTGQVTTGTSKIKNGRIELPEELLASWADADIYISGERDRISIKRLSSPALEDMLDEMNDVGAQISQHDVDSALRSARGDS